MYTLVAEDYFGPTIFGRYFNDNRFFSPLRLFTKKPSLNLDYVLNDVLEHRVPMPYDIALTTSYRISAVTTCKEGKPVLIPLSGQPKSHIHKTLKSTASMPLLGRVDALNDLEGWDGWLVEPDLLQHLSSEGITDVVWICNRPLIEDSSLPVNMLWRSIVKRLNRHNPVLAELTAKRLAAGNFLANPPTGMNLEVFEPHTNISGNCRNPATLFHALGTAYKNMASYLGHPNLPYPAEWQPWQHHMPQ